MSVESVLLCSSEATRTSHPSPQHVYLSGLLRRVKPFVTQGVQVGTTKLCRDKGKKREREAGRHRL